MKKIENPKNKVAVYTCIFGGYDELHEDYENKAPNFVDFYLITDREDINTKYYEKIIVDVADNDFHKTSRYYKINAHVLFSKYQSVLYHDGSIKVLNNSINELFEETADYDFLAFHHHMRNCTYKEAKVCKTYAIENSKVINRQVAMLKKCSFKKNQGLFAGGFIYRNISNPEITRLCKDWWNLFNQYSSRDQLSLSFLVFTSGVKYGYFKGKLSKSQFLTFYSHKRKRKVKYDTFYQYLTYKIASFYYKYFRKYWLRIKEKFMLVFFGKKPFSP